MNDRIQIAKEFAESINSDYIKQIILFGSVARGDDKDFSDIDILIISDNAKEIEDEIIDMYKAVDAISVRSLQNINLILKHAARWILHNQKKDIDNIYDRITKDLIQGCVNVAKKEGLILSREDLTTIQNELLNDTDKAILELLFLGTGGNWLKELTFFDMSQISYKEGLIYFRTGKTISIDEDTYELVRRACAEEELISFGETMRISRVKSHGLFKQRANALSASDNPNDEQDLERRFRFIQRRLLLMSKEFGVQLTSGNLQSSGLLHMLRQGIDETKLSFREYVKTPEAKELARQYDLYTDLYVQILVERFEKYFN
jgi:predicted nucleotidyltransferase